jgi:hypothetical protein
MKLSLPPKLVEKTRLGPFCKISFPVTHLMPYYAETGHTRPLNRVTLLYYILNNFIACSFEVDWQTLIFNLFLGNFQLNPFTSIQGGS